MRTLSNNTLEEIFSQYMPTTLVNLITFKGVNNSGEQVVKRFVSPSYKPVTSNGVVYQPAALRVALASDQADSMPTVNLLYDSGDRQVINELREFDQRPSCSIAVVVAERPDVVEIPPIDYEVDKWNVKDTGVQISMKALPILDEPISGDRITPTLFPFLWDNVSVATFSGGATPVPSGSPTPSEGESTPSYPRTDGPVLPWETFLGGT